MSYSHSQGKDCAAFVFTIARSRSAIRPSSVAAIPSTSTGVTGALDESWRLTCKQVGAFLPALWPLIGAEVIGGLCVGGAFMVITMAGLKEAHCTAGSANPQPHIAVLTTTFAVGHIVGTVLAS